METCLVIYQSYVKMEIYIKYYNAWEMRNLIRSWLNFITGFSAIPHLMIPSTAQATLTSILLSGVPNYSQNTPSPPPGLTPVEVHVNGMQSESKKCSPSLNGHVKVSDIISGKPDLFVIDLY